MQVKIRWNDEDFAFGDIPYSVPKSFPCPDGFEPLYQGAMKPGDRVFSYEGLDKVAKKIKKKEELTQALQMEIWRPWKQPWKQEGGSDDAKEYRAAIRPIKIGKAKREKKRDRKNDWLAQATELTAGAAEAFAAALEAAYQRGRAAAEK